jgi:hypothetical protein
VATPTDDEGDIRVEMILNRFMELIKLNEDYWVVMDEMFNFIMKIVVMYPHVRNWFYTHV